MSDAPNTVNSANLDTAVAGDTSGFPQTQSPAPTIPRHSGRIANATPEAQSVPTSTKGEKADGPDGEFFTRADEQIAQEQKHLGDPFLENTNTLQKPFVGRHSRVSSVESISNMVEEKSDSPLNKTITSVSWALIRKFTILSR